MSKNQKITFFLLSLFVIGLAVLLYVYASHSVMLNPKGMIAAKQRSLMGTATLLMLIVVIPVFVITFVFAWKYQEGKKGKYAPDWDRNHVMELIWWGIPCAIVVVLGTLAWTSSYELDPFKPISSATERPVTIQVVALDWKWLFIYPDQKIATVNFFQFPEQTPINFEISADAPMNSFWIPQLGGQVYAMPGMKTQLHLIANEIGNFNGSSANLSGRGFAGMRFVAKATSKADFNQWVEAVKQTATSLEYEQLVKPSQYNPEASYILQDEGLFEGIVTKYMVR